MIESYKKIYADLKPHSQVFWISYYLALLFSCLFLIPWAGYLLMHLRFIRTQETPDYSALISQIDDWIALGLLLIISLVFFFLVSIPVLILRFIFNFLHPFFGCLASFSLWIIIFSLMSPVFTYAVLLICEKKFNAIDALKKALGVVVVDLKTEFLLGLGFSICALPLGLLGPVGLHPIVKNYDKKFSL